MGYKLWVMGLVQNLIVSFWGVSTGVIFKNGLEEKDEERENKGDLRLMQDRVSHGLSQVAKRGHLTSREQVRDPGDSP